MKPDETASHPRKDQNPALEPARAVFSCRCDKPECEIRRLVSFRDHMAYLFNALVECEEEALLLPFTAPDSSVHTWRAVSYREKAGNTIPKYFLTTIEQFQPWYKAGAAAVPKCKDKSSVYDFSQIEIEHVYPRNATSKDPVMELLKNRLGNLSFWAPSDNTKAANQRFAAKKKIFAESKVLLNRELAKYSKFGDRQLQDREDELVKRGLAIFRM